MFEKFLHMMGGKAAKEKTTSELKKLEHIKKKIDISCDQEKVDVVTRGRQTLEQKQIVGGTATPKEIDRRQQLIAECGYSDKLSGLPDGSQRLTTIP